MTNPQNLLDNLQTKIKSLSHTHKNLSLSKTNSTVTTLLEGYFIPIANQQQLLYQDLGLERAAHILITLSYVQRIFYRFQSAYADEHEQEAETVFLRLLNVF